MKRSGLIILLLSLLACGNHYSGFETFDEKTHFKLNLLGEDEWSVKVDDYVLITYKHCTSALCEDSSEESMVATSAALLPAFWTRFHLRDEFILLLDSTDESPWKELLSLSEKAIKWPLISHLSIDGLFSKGQYQGPEAGHEKLLIYREKYELARMLSSGDFTEKKGCYVKILKTGTGDTLDIDDEILLSYKAFFSDGRKFDDTDLWKDTFRFKYGQPFQIIEGIEEGIRGLTEGTEAKIIIPSHLAFGKQGSSTALVPPYEPLLYDLKIIAVNH